MAARLKKRESYGTDAAFLLKLADAIERDREITDETRRRVTMSMLHDLAGELVRLKGVLAGSYES